MSEETLALTNLIERFVKDELLPHLDEWETKGEVPRWAHERASALGLLGIGYPEALGGTPASFKTKLAMWLAFSRVGASGGLFTALFTHGIALPPVIEHGSAQLQELYVKPVLAGKAIAALGITEPGGGSDVAGLKCSAKLEGDSYVINGEKTFISSGMRADWITLAVRTDEGISLIPVPTNIPGISRKPWEKMGWWCSDTAHIHFDNVRVPASYLIGAEGKGFKYIMQNFNSERLAMAGSAIGYAQACFDEALTYARQRSAFGSTLNEKPVIRHKFMDMHMRIASSLAWIEKLCDQADAGKTDAPWVAEVCLLKNQATQAMQFCANEAVQILGGAGYVRGSASERIYREVKVMTIGGGAEEIMKDLAARQLGV